MSMIERFDGGQPRSKSPSLLHGMLEPSRVLGEVSQLAMLWPLMASGPARGDGHRVLVLPGFMAADSSTSLLRRFLKRVNYEPIGWELGTNTGRRHQQQQLARRFVRLSARNREPLTIIGQSLGGVYARELARQFPKAVRQVITLGSPFGMSDPDSSSPLVRYLFEQMSGQDVEQMRAHIGGTDPLEALPMPSTAVYSRSDGVVHWESCVQPETDIAENIEVIASHSGMAMNAQVLAIVADRLSQPATQWRKFDHMRALRRLCIPGAASA